MRSCRLESQWWNLSAAQQTTKRLFGVDAAVYARKIAPSTRSFRAGSSTWGSSTRSWSVRTGAHPDHPLDGGELARPGWPRHRCLLPRTSTGGRSGDVLQSRLPHASGVQRRCRRPLSRSSIKANRPSIPMAIYSRSTKSSRCLASSPTCRVTSPTPPAATISASSQPMNSSATTWTIASPTRSGPKRSPDSRASFGCVDGSIPRSRWPHCTARSRPVPASRMRKSPRRTGRN